LAEEIVRKIKAKLALGTFEPEAAQVQQIPFGPHLREWHARYSVTFKPRYQETSLAILENHLVPFFGDRDLCSIREADLLDYIRVKLDAGQKPTTILTALSSIRRVLGLAVKEQLISNNPAAGVGQLISRVARSESIEVPQVESWTRAEADTLLHVALEHEPEFAHLFRFLLSTGTRRSEALGLRWEDVDFDRRQISIRRALTKGVSVTPKSGRSRALAMPLPSRQHSSTSLRSAAKSASGEDGRMCLRGCSARRQARRWTSET
jgi:integrase